MGVDQLKPIGWKRVSESFVEIHVTVKDREDSNLFFAEVVEDEVGEMMPEWPNAELEFEQALVRHAEGQGRDVGLFDNETTKVLKRREEGVGQSVESSIDVEIDMTDQILMRSKALRASAR